VSLSYTVYSVDDDGSRDGMPEGEDTREWTTSLDKARTIARRRAAGLEPTNTVTIEKVVIIGLTTKDLVMRLLNQRGFIAGRKPVATFPGRSEPALCVECGEEPAMDYGQTPDLCSGCALG